MIRCDVCHQRPMQHQLATAKAGFNLRLCYPCFDALRDIMAMYFLNHNWRDAVGTDYLSAMEQGNQYDPMATMPESEAWADGRR